MNLSLAFQLKYKYFKNIYTYYLIYWKAQSKTKLVRQTRASLGFSYRPPIDSSLLSFANFKILVCFILNEAVEKDILT